MSFPHSSRIAAILLAGSCTLAGIPAVPTVAAETASTASVRYEFENGTTAAEKSIRKLGRATPKKTAAVKITT